MARQPVFDQGRKTASMLSKGAAWPLCCGPLDFLPGLDHCAKISGTNVLTVSERPAVISFDSDFACSQARFTSAQQELYEVAGQLTFRQPSRNSPRSAR